MLYAEYIDKVKQFALITNENTGLTYIRPDWRYILYHADFTLNDVTDFEDVNIAVVREHLNLERDARNAMIDKTQLIAQWIYDVIKEVIEPSAIEAQDKLIKDMIEYRKEKNAIDERSKRLDQREQELNDANKVLPFNAGFDFGKRIP